MAPAVAAHRPRQLTHWVVDRIRADILEGRLEPGEWLRQERLAQDHGVSQTPVREALKQLATEGLLEHVPYRGIRVVTFSAEDAEDLYTCRVGMEGLAARYAATEITGTELETLSTLKSRMEKCPVPEELREYRELNRLFHQTVFTASRRPYLVRTLTALWTAFPTMLWSNVPTTATSSVPEREAPDTAEHAEILAALRSRDPERAERGVQRHIENAGIALLAAMRGEPGKGHEESPALPGSVTSTVLNSGPGR